MAEPSAVLGDIVDSLQTLMGNNVSVKAHSGNFEGKDYITNKHATILVAITNMDMDPESDYEPPVAICRFVAFCIAKQPAHPKTRGDVAMDLSALVASHVKRSVWLEEDGVVQRAENIRVLNLHTRETLQEGLSIFSVNWNQRVELTPANNNGVLNYLDEIRNTISLSDDPDVPTVGWEVDFMADREDGALVP